MLVAVGALALAAPATANPGDAAAGVGRGDPAHAGCQEAGFFDFAAVEGPDSALTGHMRYSVTRSLCRTPGDYVAELKCLVVAFNQARVVGVIVTAPAAQHVGRNLIFFVQDGGSPGAGVDRLIVGTNGPGDPLANCLGASGGEQGALLAAGEITVDDAPAVLDTDRDGVADSGDNCRLVANPGQADTDSDGVGDACDADLDGDGVANGADAFPLDPGESVDTDGDGAGNNADPDDDGDGVADAADAFPLDPAESADADGDGTGNNADADDDGDGVGDAQDAFPLDPAESVDSDGDGAGDNGDPDRDGDGAANGVDNCPKPNPGQQDTDADGLGDACDPSPRGPAGQVGDLIGNTLAALDRPALAPLLKARLEAALSAVVARNRPAACLALSLYELAVRAGSGTAFTPAEAAALAAESAGIRSDLGCS
jgi:hypothetical protein